MNIKELVTGKLNRAGIIGGIVAAFFLPPKSIAIPFGLLVIGLIALGLYLKSRWVESEPNEWMIVLRDGKLARSGIGLKTLVMPNESVVKFPSAIQRVEFSAKNVTREMQGVQIEGVAFWSVNRNDDGPFKCYKYMYGGADANTSVQTMCQSIMRNEIANSSLEEVLRQRNKLKKKMRDELQRQFTGWGVWLESVDLKDVKISSNTLFEDLQAPFRLDTHLKAEDIRLKTSEKMTEARLESEFIVNQATQDNSTQVMKTKNVEELTRQNNNGEFKEKLLEFDKRRIQAEKDLTLSKLAGEQERDLKRVENEQALQKTRVDFNNKTAEQLIELDKEHNEVSLQKYSLDATERIYKKMSTREIKVNQFVGDTKNVVASLLPGLQFAIAQGRAVDS